MHIKFESFITDKLRIVLQRNKIFWSWLELVVYGVGGAGSAIACMANYDWHWRHESITYSIWAAVPFVLLAFGAYIARRLIRSNFLRPVIVIIAIVMTVQSLTAYILAVLHPNHSSGMIFVILPLCWIIAIFGFISLIVLSCLIVYSLKKRN